MKKLLCILLVILITAPVFAKHIRVRPRHVSWRHGASPSNSRQAMKAEKDQQRTLKGFGSGGR